MVFPVLLVCCLAALGAHTSEAGGGSFDPPPPDTATRCNHSADRRSDFGPSRLFNDPTLGDGVIDPGLAVYLRTIDEIKELQLQDLNITFQDCTFEDPCLEPVPPDSSGVRVIKGSFESGVMVMPTCQAMVSFIGQEFPHIETAPEPGIEGDLQALLDEVIPVSMVHDFEVIVPGDPATFDWMSERAGFAIVGVTQHGEKNPRKVEPLGRRLRGMATYYGVPAVHVTDVLTFQLLTCADPDYCDPSEEDPLGYVTGNTLLRLTSAFVAAVGYYGVPLTDELEQFVNSCFGMYPYIQAYAGSITFARRMLEKLAVDAGFPGAPGHVASRIITGGGSKDGLAAALALDVDDRIHAVTVSGGDIIDQVGIDGYYERINKDWGRCGYEEDWIYMPGASVCALPYLRETVIGEAYIDCWSLYKIIPQYSDRGGETPSVIWKWSTHDLHYPLGSTHDFWWNTEAFSSIWHRQLIAVNHDHGGVYDPGPGEPYFRPYGGWNLLLERLINGREPVDVSIEWEYDDPLAPTAVTVTGAITSPDGHPVEGARYFVARSTDRNFSIAKGIEGPEWSMEFPFTRMGNEGLLREGPYGPEGNYYGGFAWTYAATNSKGQPVAVDGAVIEDPWGSGNDEVVYLYPFPPEECGIPEGLMEDSGFFVRYPVEQHHLTAGEFGIDSRIEFRITIPVDAGRAAAVLMYGWDRDRSGRVTYDFSRYFIACEQLTTFEECSCM